MQLFYNTKLCTQILCYMIVILLPCFCIFIGIMYANFQLFQGMVLNSSLEILNRQFSRQIKTFSKFSHQMIEKYQFREMQRLESVNRVYQFTWDIDLKLQNIEQCVNKKYSKYSGKCQMCYGIVNETVNLSQTNFNKYLKIANLFSVTLLMGDNSFDIVFAGNSEEKFMAIWPSQGVAKTPPNAQLRPWYKLEYYQPNTSQLYSTHFTQPYIHLSLKTVTVSHTQTLYDKDFSRIGVVTIQLNFSSTFPSFLQNSTKIKGYILDENLYILQRKEQDTSVNTFFDSNVTGFDNSSTDILKAYLKDGQILQNCQKLNTKLLCLKDVYNQEYIVQAYILQEQNQIFILVFNPTYDLLVLQQRQDTLIENLNLLIQAVLISTIPSNVGLLFFTILFIYLIANTISEITEQANGVVFKNNADHFKMLQFQIFDIENKVSLNCLEKLEIAFVTLNHKMIHNSKRNPQCQKMIEICDYWEKNKLIIIDLKKSINQLDDKDFCPPKLVVKKIIKEGILRCFQKDQKTN